ncbi:cancer/testis antigen family 47 member C1 isoform X1 [Rattus norvegicus]|uniref:cancer/testis antigen family 47 member C1 isoform X1 n=1 Tax=Rattus norvegicus TaxID=10116 RepID=UPI00062E14D7
MSTRGRRDPTRESRDNPVTLEGEWVLEAAEGGAVGLDGSSATLEAEEVVVDCHREVEDVGPERNPEQEGDRRESVNVEEDSDIEAVEEEEDDQHQESDLANQNVVDAHHFPMAGFRFMFLDLVHAILNRVYYNDHILVRDPRENQVMGSSNTSESGHPRELQVPPGPIPSTVRASEYEHQGSDLPEVISTFPELEEPADFEEDYLQEPAFRAAGQAVEEVAEEAAAEEPAKEIIGQAMTSEGENHCARQYKDDNIVDEEEEEEEEEMKNEGFEKMDSDAEDYCTNKFRSLCIALSINHLPYSYLSAFSF